MYGIKVHPRMQVTIIERIVRLFQFPLVRLYKFLYQYFLLIFFLFSIVLYLMVLRLSFTLFLYSSTINNFQQYFSKNIHEISARNVQEIKEICKSISMRSKLLVKSFRQKKQAKFYSFLDLLNITAKFFLFKYHDFSYS